MLSQNKKKEKKEISSIEVSCFVNLHCAESIHLGVFTKGESLVCLRYRLKLALGFTVPLLGWVLRKWFPPVSRQVAQWFFASAVCFPNHGKFVRNNRFSCLSRNGQETKKPPWDIEKVEAEMRVGTIPSQSLPVLTRGPDRRQMASVGCEKEGAMTQPVL